MPYRFLSARGTAIGKPGGHSPAAARAIVERQLAIVHRRWRVLVDDGACHLRVEFSKRLVWRQRTRAIVASEDKRPGGELVLALEIQAGRPGSSIRPGPLWMALAPRLGQLDNSHGVQCDRHQTVHRLQPDGSDGKTNSSGCRYASGSSLRRRGLEFRQQRRICRGASGPHRGHCDRAIGPSG